MTWPACRYRSTGTDPIEVCSAPLPAWATLTIAQNEIESDRLVVVDDCERCMARQG